MNGDYFIFDGQDSRQFDLYLINLGSGFAESTFGSKRKISEENVPDNPIPNLYSITDEPLTVDLTFVRTKPWTYEDRVKVAGWLFKNNYKELMTSDNMGLVYYVTTVGDPKKFMTMLDMGYCSITLRCDAPWGYSPYSIAHYDFSSLITPQTFTINNTSNIDSYHYPEIEFTLCGSATSFKIQNVTNGGEIFEFTGLTQGESVYVNNQYKRIITDMGLSRLSNFNKQWFRTVGGKNIVKIFTPAKIDIRTQYPIMV